MALDISDGIDIGIIFVSGNIFSAFPIYLLFNFCKSKKGTSRNCISWPIEREKLFIFK